MLYEVITLIQRKCNGLLFARLKIDFVKALQFFGRAHHRTFLIADI